MQEPDGGLAARIFFVGSCCIVCDVIHNAEKSCTGIREKSAIVSQLFASCSVWASTGKIVSNWIWDNTCCPMLQFHNWPAHCLFHLFKVQCTKSWTRAVIFIPLLALHSCICVVLLVPLVVECINWQLQINSTGDIHMWTSQDLGQLSCGKRNFLSKHVCLGATKFSLWIQLHTNWELQRANCSNHKPVEPGYGLLGLGSWEGNIIIRILSMHQVWKQWYVP
jgi:hypothetical protein